MPKSALPEGFKVHADGTSTDWDWWGQRWLNKAFFAYGPRATQWWAKWREFPFFVIGYVGKGNGRWENSDGSQEDAWPGQRWLTDIRRPHRKMGPGSFYFSAIQYWAKWHVALQWPLHFTAHYYIDDVPQYPEQAGNRRVFYFRIGARRDADRVYWCPSVFIGLQWN